MIQLQMTQKVYIAVQLLLDGLVFSGYEIVNALCYMVEIGVCELVHFVLSEPVILAALPDGQRNERDSGNHHAADAEQ